MALVTTPQENKKLLKTRLMSPKDFREQDYHSKACFSRDYKQYGFLDNWEQAINILSHLPHGENVYNELILDSHKVKPYLDVEWYKNDFENYRNSDVKQKIIRCLIYIFKKFYSKNLKEEEIFFSKCHRQSDKGYKNSFHVVITTKPKMIIFENNNHAMVLARQVREYMDKLIDENYEIVDESLASRKTKSLCFEGEIVDIGVYRKTQNMRLIGHIKSGSNEPFVPDNDDNEDIRNYIITDISNEVDIITRIPEQDDELFIENNSEIHKDITDDELSIIIEKVKTVHPSAYFEKQDSLGYLQFNYSDRKEECFTGSLHDKIGFFVYISSVQANSEKIVYMGCHSGNCVCVKSSKTGEEIKKSIKNLGYLNVTAPSADQPVSHSETFSIDFDTISEKVFDGAQGLAELFRKMYLEPKRIKSQVSTAKGGMDLFYWDGKIWREDDRGFIDDIISTSLKKLLKDFLMQIQNSPGLLDESLSKETSALVNKLKNNVFSPNIMKSIRPYLDDKEFAKNKDIHPYYLSCKNGMVNLKTGEIRQALPEDNVTKTIETSYNPDADSSDFEKFIRQITSDTNGELPEVYDYFKWCIGYALQGAPKKKLFILLFGPHGFNGKSLVMNTIKDTLENYSVSMDSSVVLETGTGKSAGSHSTEIMQLENCRVGILSDTPEEAVINDGRMKMLTGGTDTMSGREIYGKQRDFKPCFVPFISTNHVIRINLADMAMYERLVLFPFVLSFIDSDLVFDYQRKADNDLAEKFASNREGVLKWLIEASLYYNSDTNKKIPEYLVRAKERYNREINPIVNFVDEYLETKEDCKISRKKLLDIYKEYVTSNGGAKYYKRRIAQQEFDRRYKSDNSTGICYYIGVQLRNSGINQDILS